MHIKVCGMIGWYQKDLDACCCEKQAEYFCVYHIVYLVLFSHLSKGHFWKVHERCETLVENVKN